MALAVLGAALATVAGISDAADDGPPPELLGHRMPDGARARPFVLSDQEGHRFNLLETRGRVVAMTFIHSRCTSTCPVTLQTMRGALDQLGGDRAEVDMLAVSVDPEADTARSVRRFLREQRVDSVVRYLTGSRPALERVWKSYGIRPQGNGQEDHSAFVLLVDRRGFMRVGEPASLLTPETLANDLRILVNEPV